MRAWLVGLSIVGAALGVIFLSPRASFVVGGAFVNAGYRMQDGLHSFDFEHEHPTPDEVLRELKGHNELAAAVRDRFPRSTVHPLVALLVCMDARIDTNELIGDTRRNHYVVRTAGSVLGPAEADMLELAVTNGVELVVLTRHTDCAAEKVAKSAELRVRYPHLVAGVDERDVAVRKFMERPFIAEKIAKGELLVRDLVIDTASERLIDPTPSL